MTENNNPMARLVRHPRPARASQRYATVCAWPARVAVGFSLAVILAMPFDGRCATDGPIVGALINNRYERLCDALVQNNVAAVQTLLGPAFVYRGPDGQVHSAEEFSHLNSGGLRLIYCAVRVTAIRPISEGNVAHAVWTLKGRVTAAGSTKSFTAIEEVDDVWAQHDAKWLIDSELISIRKNWADGRREPTETYAGAPSPRQRRVIIADLRRYAHPLTSADPGEYEADLAPILHAVGRAKIIGMGEASHGTSEFFSLKDRVFRYLVEHDGVHVLAVEASWSVGKKVDAYLQSGTGNIRDILAETWDSREVLILLQWMRHYNISHPHALHFFGMDMQQSDSVVPYVLDYFKTYDPARADAVQDDETCIDRPTTVLFKDRLGNAPRCIAATRSVVLELLRGAKHRDAARRAAYLTAFHAAELAEESAIEYSHKNIVEKAATRDQAMAHNVEWLVDELHPSSKVFLWAHNAHIGVGLEAWPSMGTMLRQSYGSDYFTIGQTFDHGSVGQPRLTPAAIPPATGNASEIIFRQAGASPFFLDFSEVPLHSGLGYWLAEPHGIRSLGGDLTATDLQNGEIETVLPSAFNAITFVDVSHPAQWFQTPTARQIETPAQWGRLGSQEWTFSSFVAEDAAAGVTVMADGKSAMYLTARAEEPNLFAYVRGSVDAEPYRGKKVNVTGVLSTADAAPGAMIVFEVLGADTEQALVYRSTPKPMLTGTNPWNPFSINVDIPQKAQKLSIGLVLSGAGTVWLESLEIEELGGKESPTARSGAGRTFHGGSKMGSRASEKPIRQGRNSGWPGVEPDRHRAILPATP